MMSFIYSRHNGDTNVRAKISERDDFNINKHHEIFRKNISSSLLWKFKLLVILYDNAIGKGGFFTNTV